MGVYKEDSFKRKTSDTPIVSRMKLNLSIVFTCMLFPGIIKTPTFGPKPNVVLTFPLFAF